jgi:two-component system OmpR family sensor kinase
MIALLCMLGVLVAGTTEIFLNKTLYEQTDAKLRDAQGRTHNFYGSNGQSGVRPPRASRSDGGAPPGTQVGQLIAVMNSAGTIDFAVYAKSAPDYSVSMADLPADARKKVAALTPDGKEHTVDLGSLGAYRLIASFDPNGSGTVNVAGLPLSELRRTLLRVALVTGGAVLIALGIAGWAGAVIVRRTLRPLDRVAATATRVSELRLDHGEVRLAQRVPAGDTDPHTEVGQVGAALNRMLDHVGNALEARHASEMQVRQFVADASHELRTPLAAIRGYAELSRRSRAPISEEIAHVLGRVESEAKRMTGLVEDLLLLARLDSGRPLAHDPVDLTMLVVDAVSDAHAAGPRHYWQLDLPEEPVTVVGDGQRLHQVLANLLANARTHTPEGTTVTVAVGATADAAVLRVIDFGPGIPAELQPHIFERFARGDSSRSRAAGSTGLGLSIVSAVVAAHRGTVSVDSQPGQTVFTVTLPLARVPAGEQLARTLPRAR